MFVEFLYHLLVAAVIMLNYDNRSIITIGSEQNLQSDSSTILVQMNKPILCQIVNTDNCSELFELIIKCQQMIFNDPGFSYQEYLENIDVHRQMLVKYQTMCEGSD